MEKMVNPKRNDMKNILFAVVGLVPNVVTEALWYFNVKKNIPIEELHIVTTSAGKNVLLYGNRKRNIRKFLGGDGVIEEFCREYDVSLEFSESNIKVISDDKGSQESDVRNVSAMYAAGDTIFKEYKRLTDTPNSSIHCVVSGGRRLLTYFLGLSMTVWGRKQDYFYYTDITPKEIQDGMNTEFYYIPKNKTKISYSTPDGNKEIISSNINIELVEVPLLKLGDRFKGLPEAGDTLSEQITRLQGLINTTKPSISTYRGETFEIIGENKNFLKQLEKLKIYAQQDPVKSVLIYGETGTGKELFAKYFQQHSNRNKHIAINCAQFGELIDSELFGTVKGAYTGAIDKKGILSEYDGGTVFLDEINSLDKPHQAKLLRFIQEGEIRPVGSNETKQVDARIILGLNEHPQKWLESGNVRPDFYNRIIGNLVIVPPLRERPEDIEPLINYFLSKYSAIYSKGEVKIAKEVVNKLKKHHWKLGNVRELEHKVEEMIIFLPDGETIVTELPEDFMIDEGSDSTMIIDQIGQLVDDQSERIDLPLDEVIKRHIQHQLNKQGSVPRAAKVLKVNPNTLHARMKKLGLKSPKA